MNVMGVDLQVGHPIFSFGRTSTGVSNKDVTAISNW